MIVVRVWVERGADGLRARIVEVEDLESAAEVSRTAAGIDEICRIVRAFLIRFVGDSADDVTSR